MRPRCGQLVFSWVLLIGAVALMGSFGHVGLLFAALLVGVQRVRGEHDREALERYKQNTVYMALALLYYAAVSMAAITAVIHYHDLLDMNFGFLMVLFFLPVMVGMMVADHAACRARRDLSG